MKTPVEIIKSEISQRGSIPFERFMELALYAPECGYYETEKDKVGKEGDFYTSVSVGSLFGELLAFQFSEWFQEMGTNGQVFKIAEAGAHDGKLASDILGWFQKQRPQMFEKLEYIIVEPSVRRREWQHETLKSFSNVRWVSNLTEPTIQQFNGIFFSNELLDAFPVRRFGWDAQDTNWFEWSVGFYAGKFVWTKAPCSSCPISAPDELLAILPHNYTIEISPSAEKWWREAAGILQNGKLLALDYGFAADDIFSPTRLNGTVRAYSRHRVSDDILANVGEQDLTAHVNFSTIRKTGEDSGLMTEIFASQTRFLTDILAKAAKSQTFGAWESSHTRQFQTLTHPEHLGRVFHVLVQMR